MTLTDNRNGTATLAGTSAVAPGVYTFSIQAANGITPNATQAFTLTVTKAPAITSAARDTVPSGTAFTYSVTTTGTPTPAITLASGSTLPSGVTLTDNGNGTATLAGTSSVAPGIYTFSIQAANGIDPQRHPGLHADGDQGPRHHQRGQRHRPGGDRLHLLGDHHGHTDPGHHVGLGFDPASGVTLTDNGNGTATLAGTSAVAAGTYKFTIQAAKGSPPTPPRPSP